MNSMISHLFVGQYGVNKGWGGGIINSVKYQACLEEQNRKYKSTRPLGAPK